MRMAATRVRRRGRRGGPMSVTWPVRTAVCGGAAPFQRRVPALLRMSGATGRPGHLLRGHWLLGLRLLPPAAAASAGAQDDPRGGWQLATPPPTPLFVNAGGTFMGTDTGAGGCCWKGAKELLCVGEERDPWGPCLSRRSRGSPFLTRAQIGVGGGSVEFLELAHRHARTRGACIGLPLLAAVDGGAPDASVCVLPRGLSATTIFFFLLNTGHCVFSSVTPTTVVRHRLLATILSPPRARPLRFCWRPEPCCRRHRRCECARGQKWRRR